jgi:hypothetical protein
VPAPDKRDRLGDLVGVSRGCVYLDLLSSGNGERGGWSARTVIL